STVTDTKATDNFKTALCATGESEAAKASAFMRTARSGLVTAGFVFNGVDCAPKKLEELGMYAPRGKGSSKEVALYQKAFGRDEVEGQPMSVSTDVVGHASACQLEVFIKDKEAYYLERALSYTPTPNTCGFNFNMVSAGPKDNTNKYFSKQLALL